MGVLALTLVGGGAGGMFLLGPMIAGRNSEAADTRAADAGAARAPDERGAVAIYTIDNIVLNPAMSNGSRFLLMAAAVECADKAIVEDLKNRDAEARDLLISVMAARTVEQLTDIAQRDSLRREIASALNAMLKRPTAVRRIYFSQFVVQ